MSNNKQSSVDWLIAELGEYFPHEIGGIELMVRKAKAMHEEEIMDAYHDGKTNGMDISHPLSLTKEILASEYYNETFGGNNEQQ
jgi:hypothetical protein